ncbi:predicted protein [Plenodomus lingam JN3]|uniref:Predicted protein n=1 Tax=Leptosphaeria maculans (strain JN3 / isolate v23.1.3 / race Av1-4-5-6-7-8) TaxID=985895 RepID=E5AFP6_LEPMJ|nr:predicted protein [Plenodomus lingam JN3]CBY02035.1 predicted protein [Plenodomus lingam JN3]
MHTRASSLALHHRSLTSSLHVLVAHASGRGSGRAPSSLASPLQQCNAFSAHDVPRLDPTAQAQGLSQTQCITHSLSSFQRRRFGLCGARRCYYMQPAGRFCLTQRTFSSSRPACHEGADGEADELTAARLRQKLEKAPKCVLRVTLPCS